MSELSPAFEAFTLASNSLGKIDFRDSQFGYAMRALIAYGEAYAKMKEVSPIRKDRTRAQPLTET